MSIVRRVVSKNYTIITNNCFEDSDLTGELLGLLTYLLSRPHNWRVRPPHIAKRMGWGRDKTYNGLNALADLGYAEKRQLRDQITGMYKAFEYVVYDERFAGLSETSPQTEIPLPEDQKAAKRINTKTQKILPLNPPHEALDSSLSVARTNRSTGYPDNASSKSLRTDANSSPTPWVERGRYEAEVANRLGKDGWDILNGLPDWLVMQLCRTQSRTGVTDQAIADLKYEYVRKLAR